MSLINKLHQKYFKYLPPISAANQAFSGKLILTPEYKLSNHEGMKTRLTAYQRSIRGLHDEIHGEQLVAVEKNEEPLFYVDQITRELQELLWSITNNLFPLDKVSVLNLPQPSQPLLHSHLTVISSHNKGVLFRRVDDERYLDKPLVYEIDPCMLISGQCYLPPLSEDSSADSINIPTVTAPSNPLSPLAGFMADLKSVNARQGEGNQRRHPRIIYFPLPPNNDENPTLRILSPSSPKGLTFQEQSLLNKIIASDYIE